MNEIEVIEAAQYGMREWKAGFRTGVIGTLIGVFVVQLLRQWLGF